MDLLGGLGDDVLIRRVHGWTGALFFAVCAVLVTVTSRRWRETAVQRERQPARRVKTLAMAQTLGLLLMILLGTMLRHQPIGSSGADFETWDWVKSISGGSVSNSSGF